MTGWAVDPGAEEGGEEEEGDEPDARVAAATKRPSGRRPGESERARAAKPVTLVATDMEMGARRLRAARAGRSGCQDCCGGEAAGFGDDLDAVVGGGTAEEAGETQEDEREFEVEEAGEAEGECRRRRWGGCDEDEEARW